MEVPSDHDGIVKQINIKEGDSVKEGQLFAILEVESKQAEDPQNIIEKIATPSIKENKREVFEQTTNFSGINAGPAVRKVARELEIDLSKIDGTGKNSLITKEDLKNFIHSSSKASTSYANIESLKEFGDYEITDQSKIRSLGARNLAESWTSIPHVTHFEEIDITEIEKQRAELNKNSKIKITPVAYVAVKVIAALKEYPLLNSSLVGEGKVMLRNYYNLGIAVDTVGGLLVPVVKDADNLDISGLASEIADLAEKAKKEKVIRKKSKRWYIFYFKSWPNGRDRLYTNN